MANASQMRRWRAALAVSSCLALAACGGGPKTPAMAPVVAAETVKIAPQADTRNVALNAPVTVTATRGALSHVDVTDPAGEYLAGAFNDAHTAWTSTAPLRPDTDYRVHATATGDHGDPVTNLSS